jgi:hypothetical protein
MSRGRQLAAEPGEREAPKRRRAVLHQPLEATHDGLLHAADAEILVAVATAEVALLGGQEDQLEIAWVERRQQVLTSRHGHRS